MNTETTAPRYLGRCVSCGMLVRCTLDGTAQSHGAFSTGISCRGAGKPVKSYTQRPEEADAITSALPPPPPPPPRKSWVEAVDPPKSTSRQQPQNKGEVEMEMKQTHPAFQGARGQLPDYAGREQALLEAMKGMRRPTAVDLARKLGTRPATIDVVLDRLVSKKEVVLLKNGAILRSPLSQRPVRPPVAAPVEEKEEQPPVEVEEEEPTAAALPPLNQDDVEADAVLSLMQGELVKLEKEVAELEASLTPKRERLLRLRRAVKAYRG